MVNGLLIAHWRQSGQQFTRKHLSTNTATTIMKVTAIAFLLLFIVELCIQSRMKNGVVGETLVGQTSKRPKAMFVPVNDKVKKRKHMATMQYLIMCF